MLSRTKMAGAAVALAGFGVALPLAFATHQRRRRARALLAGVTSGHAGAGQDVARQQLDALPPVVARYLRRALGDRPRVIRTARFTQSGTLRTDPRAARWFPFEARQTVTPMPPGFVWDARVHVAPMIHLRVADSYIRGRGCGEVSVLSAWTVTRENDTPILNRGQLYRYLAEGVWYPTALLPGSGVEWTGIDETRAKATLADAGATVSLEFRFNDRDEVVSVFAEDRGMRVGDEFRPTPWEGRVRQYADRDGLHIPTEAEVGWHLDGEWHPVWRGTTLTAEYEF